MTKLKVPPITAFYPDDGTARPMMTTVGIVEDNPRSPQEWVDATPSYRSICACNDAETALKTTSHRPEGTVD